ncbi:MAG: sulfite exporter TauE/SafE family protein [Dehalococcoidia bacterium]
MKRVVPISILIGAVAGMQAGLTGVGGGVFLVPLMVGLLGVAQHQAHGTSLTVIFPIAVVGAITYAFLGYIPGDIDWVLIPALAIGGVAGVFVGAKLMTRVPARQLRWIFSAFMLVLGIYMIVT